MEIQASELINGHVSPQVNKGSSQPDIQAIGPDQESKTEWLRSRGIDVSARVRIKKLSHMRYQHPDLDEISSFLEDFGMHVVQSTDSERWFRGYGPDQYVYYARKGPKQFLGGAFEVESESELEKVLDIPGVKILNGGISQMLNGPGAGYIVSAEDPEGFPINLVYGQTAPEKVHETPEKLILNDETHKPRQRKFQRFEPGPAEVFKVGHYGMVVENFHVAMDWYTRYFNFVPSDILYVTVPGAADNVIERKEVALFAHIDRGDDLVDHHTLFLSSAVSGNKCHVHHCSFEVHDFDTQALGHQWLSRKNYNSVWGVGRHILGSQVFDYWWDPNKFMVEHYADGDVVNMETPMGYAPAGHEGLAVWGPEVPKAFLE